MLKQDICVLCRHNFPSFPPAIRVFQNRNQFRLNARIDIGESVKSPEDIGSSDKENCFFVADSAENCVWEITRQTGDYHKFVDLQSANLYSWPSTLSVSCDGEGILILTLHSLDIYGTFRQDGAAQKPPLSVHLPSDIEDPIHAVETSSGHFIILHSLRRDFGETAVPKEKETKAKNRMYVVSKLTRDGRLVVRRYVPQNKGQELSDPCYLALDSDDRVFVADAEDDRVIILDSDLNSARISCPTEDEGMILKMPYRICYDKVERQFIMAGLRSRQGVDIYSIDRK